MTDNRLKSYADRIDALEEEKKGISGDIKDVFTEVKSAGYNANALRKVLAERRKKTDAELEADIELYRAALAEPGATYRSVSAKTGIPKSTLQRRVPRERNGTSEPRTTQPMQSNPAPQDSSLSRAPAAADGAPSAVLTVPQGGEGTGTHSVAERVPGDVPIPAVVDAGGGHDERLLTGESCGQPDRDCLGVDADETVAAPGPHDTSDDDLTPPDFLRGPARRSMERGG